MFCVVASKEYAERNFLHGLVTFLRQIPHSSYEQTPWVIRLRVLSAFTELSRDCGPSMPLILPQIPYGFNHEPAGQSIMLSHCINNGAKPTVQADQRLNASAETTPSIGSDFKTMLSFTFHEHESLGELIAKPKRTSNKAVLFPSAFWPS